MRTTKHNMVRIINNPTIQRRNRVDLMIALGVLIVVTLISAMR